MKEGVRMSFAGFLHACEAEEKVNLTHVICADGRRVLASYVRPPYRMDTLRLFFSMTKSFASLAVGIAWDQGRIALDERLSDIFKEEWPERPHPNAEKITVRHLLTMSGGMNENTYGALFAESDWVRAYLGQEFPSEPGTRYRYSTHGSHMLSALIGKKAGWTLDAFLNEYLFHPLGIYEAQWEHSPEGLIAGGMGLSMYPASLVKIAQLILNRGVYESRRLISEEYLSMAMSGQIVKQDDVGRADCEFGGWEYGFQFHIGKRGYSRMDGAFGQVCLICPDRDLAVIAFSGGSKTERLLKLMYEHLMDGNMDAPQGLSSWKRSLPLESIPSGKWQFNTKDGGLREIELTGETDGTQKMIVLDAFGQNEYRFSAERDMIGRARFIKDLEAHEQEYACRAYIGDALVIEVFYIETPYVARYRMTFEENDMLLEWDINVSLTLKRYSCRGRKI